jgi:hypothetical protein
MKTSSDWLTQSWAAADTHAQRLLARPASGPSDGLVILPARQRRRTASGRLLAAILAHTGHVPATVVCAPTIVAGQRRALAERLPHATLTVVDWCHPAPGAPAEVTILEPRHLRRASATIGGYQAQTIAILAGDAKWDHRDLSALTAVMDGARNPLIVVEEWADHAAIAAAAARIAQVPQPAARNAVIRWLDGGQRPVQSARTRDMARGVLELCRPLAA